MHWNDFISIPNGTEIFNHGYSECVALANLYHESVLGGAFVPVQSAHQWWTQHWPQLSAYHRASRPVAGSIVVWNTRWGAGHGHIGIVTSVLPDGRFTTMEQNAGGGPAHRFVNRYTRSMTGVLGFLIPVNNPATPRSDQIQEEELMADQVYITTSAKNDPYYRYSYVTGTKRFIPSREWNAIRKIEREGGPNVVLVEVSKADFDAIPTEA